MNEASAATANHLLSAASASQSWAEFTTAQSTQAFLQGWLGVLCADSANASASRGAVVAAALLIKDPAANSLVPAAVWPAANQDLSRLNAIVERCVKENRGLVEPLVGSSMASMPAPGLSPPGSSLKWQLAYPILSGSGLAGAVVAETEGDAAHAQRLMKQLHWGLGWLIESFERGAAQAARAQAKRLLSVTEALAVALQPRKLRETLFDIANDTARRLDCVRVGIGLVKHETIKLMALSDVAWIEKSSALSKLYVAAMEETLDGRQIIVHPAPMETSAQSNQATVSEAAANENTKNETTINEATLSPPAPRHAELAAERGAAQVLSVPFMAGVDCVAVMLLQWRLPEDCTAERMAWIDAYAALLPAVIADKERGERGLLARAWDAGKGVATVLFGPRHLIWKTATVLTLLLVAAAVLISIDYRVPAKMVLEGHTQRVAAAPFEGFVSAAPARAGDRVSEGQLLAQLDDRDLKVELAKATAEREQHQRRLREAMAAREMSAVQIHDAQFKQAEAQAKLIAEKITRAKILAPFDGVVVSGDLTQTIGSPVETGKKLFEIAPLERYRVILQVDEKEIRHVRVGQAGQVVISGLNDEPADFTVTKITPIATAQEGKNTFRVEAQLTSAADPRLRPGMEGVGKISAGPRRLWWIATHGFTDWLRLALWNWLP